MARVALVLGAGGTVGHAFHAGVLTALAEELGWDARRADVLVGTSAGSIVAALLRAGLRPSDLAARGGVRPLSPDGAAIVRRAGLRPPRPRPPRSGRGSFASPAQLRRAVRAPWTVTPGSLAAAVLPEGHVSTEGMAVPFDNLFGDAWPSPATWIVAVQLDTGRRVAFGRSGAPPARISEALRASCAIPAYLEPVTIGGRRYVDGGVHSTTNADLAGTRRGPKPDLVLVSAPMSAARGAARPGRLTAIRQFARLSLAREVAALRARGIPVVTFQPGIADLEVMSGDSLDPSKFVPVAARVVETTARRLDRADVRQRLAAIG